MDDYEEAILFTYALLESRLDRIEYVLSGAKEEGEERPRSLPERIQRMERLVQEFSEKTTLLDDAREFVSKHTDLLEARTSARDDGPNLDTSQKAAMVVERAPGFASTASQLKALDDQQIPETDGFAKLAKLRPRIAEMEERHLQQALQVSLLRRKSGLLVSRYKQIHVAGTGRCLAEYQQRAYEMDKRVKRLEFKQKQETEG